MTKRFIRIIPKLDIKNGLLIKGINLEGLRILGDPFEYARFYSKYFADEICYLDNVATLYGTNSLTKFIKRTSENLKIPLLAGGGIKSIKDIKKILNSGADRVCLNSAIFKNPKIVSDAAKIFGSSTISVLIEYTKIDNKYFLTYSNGRDLVNKEPLSWAKKMEDLGAGEIILTSVRHEGLMKGCDLKIPEQVSAKLKIPVLSHGGVGKKEDVLELINNTDISGILIAGYFHYGICHSLPFKKKIVGNTDYLTSINKNKFRMKNNLIKLKKYLNNKGINVRLH